LIYVCLARKKNTLHCHWGFDHFEDWKYKKKLQRNAGDKNKVNGLPLMVPISIMMRSYVTS